MAQVPITPLQLPAGFCPENYQDLWNTFAKNGIVQIPDGATPILWQTNPPSDLTVAWGKIDSLGRPVGIFKFAQGTWLLPHSMLPGMTIWWFYALPDFTSFDGGDGNGLSPISGPMWQLAKDIGGNPIAAQFPIAAGTLPSSTVLNVGDKGGEETHKLVAGEIPKTTITPSIPKAITSGLYNSIYRIALAPQSGTQASSDINLNDITFGNDQPHNNMPPYIVGYLLQRTTRLFYVG